MNAKISVFVICVEEIIYLLYNLRDCTLKGNVKWNNSNVINSLIINCTEDVCLRECEEYFSCHL